MSSFNLADLFESLADSFPDRPALVVGEEQLTFGQLDRRANRLAQYWMARGVGEGDHIGLCLFNGVPYLQAMLAAWKIRARTINVNYRYRAPELRYIFENARMVGVLYEPELADDVRAALLPAMKHNLQPGVDFEAAVAAHPDTREGFPERSVDDLVIIYTGGTTGMPRGVMWRHEDLFFAALQGGNPGGVPFTDPDEMVRQITINGDGIHVLGAPPLIHGSSQLASWIAMLNGGVAGLVPGRSFDAEAILDLCSSSHMHTVNIVGDAMALPIIAALEANEGRWDLSELLVIASAGAVLSGTVRARLETLLPHAMCLNNFGASETGHQGAAFYEDGKPVWFMDESHTVVLDDDHAIVEPGSDTVGWLARYGHIPLGYFGDEEKTRRTFVMSGGRRYVIPGDRARVSADGTIEFLGRDSVCINSGGEKVYAEEVEEALKAHPHVFDAIVVGVPDERWTNRVEAVVTLRVPESEADLDSIRTSCRELLAGYKVPKAVWVTQDLHRQPSGKPNYKWARDHAIQRHAEGME